MLVLGLSNLFCAPGGIPAFNRLLVRSARAYAQACSLPLRVLVLADAADTAPEEGLDAGAYVPCGGSRRRFIGAVLALLWRRPLLCLGHVNLAPLGPLSPRGFGVVAHGTEVWQPLPLLRRLALRQARAVACVSDHTARCVERVQGVRASRCVRVINSLPPERFPADQAAAACSGERLRVLSVTRLYPGEPKGIDLMLEALAQLPQIDYVVAGEGAALPGLKLLARRLGVADRVWFLGRISDEERAAQFASCDVFALPSSGEGFGIAYLEAMAYGKPCVAARVGGAPEVVLDGETGLVVTPQVAPLVTALRALRDDAGLRRRLGAAGRERLAAHFCYARFQERAFHFLARL